MAEFSKVIKEQKRMCRRFISCIGCPLGEAQKEIVSCKDWTFNNPEKAEEIIMRWSEKHPIMTNRKKFEEVFGFNIATMFEVHDDNAKWLDEEYKEKIANE